MAHDCDEAMPLIEALCGIVLCVNHKSKGTDVAGRHIFDGVRQESRAQLVALRLGCYGQPSHENDWHNRVTWQPLRQCIGNLGKGEAHRTECIESSDGARRQVDSDHALGDTPANVLRHLSFEIPIEGLGATGECGSTVLLSERLDQIGLLRLSSASYGQISHGSADDAQRRLP